jgi:hypothetical protein
MDRPEPDPATELLDESRTADAAARRERERWLRHQAEEGATLAGTLVDISEQAMPVTLRTTSGRTHQCHVTAVGGDFVAVQAASGQQILVRIDAITVVRPQPGGWGGPTGDRPGPVATTLVTQLADMVERRPRLLFVFPGGAEQLGGDLLAVGNDVATVVLEDGRTQSHVNLRAVTEVYVLASG